jgi:cytochrome c5
MDEHDPHSSPIKTPKQLVIVVVLAFVVPIAVILLITQLVTGVPHDTGGDAAVRVRIAPVGTVEIAGPGTAAAAPTPVAAAASPAATGPVDGKKVYDGACVACHGAGIAGAPKFGDKAAWASRVAQGAPVLYDHAIKGYQGKAGVMPPKGGAMQLTDAQVKAAVDAMVTAAK